VLTRNNDNRRIYDRAQRHASDGVPDSFFFFFFLLHSASFATSESRLPSAEQEACLHCRAWATKEEGRGMWR